MNIIWIGLAVPDEMSATLSASDKYITGQTQAFQTRIIQALEQEGRNRVQIVSSPPLTDWSKVRFTPLRHWHHSAGAAPDVVVPIVNLFGLKQVSVFLGCFLACCGMSHRPDARRTMIVVGDSYFPHLLAAWLASRVNRLRVVAFITDVPGLLTVADPWYKSLLRPLDAAVVLGLLRRMDSLVVLSPHIAGDFFPDTRCLVMQGIVDPGPPPPDRATPGPGRDFIIMYSGALMAEYGLPLLLGAFRKLAGEEWQLWITGKGDYEPRVREAAQQDARIKFLGYVGADELRSRMRQAAVLINLRTDHSGHARYSFPSKLLEYMTQECFVVTNRFPSLPEAYARHLIVLQSETAEELAALLRRIRDGAYGDVVSFARRMRGFVLGEATAGVQAARLGDFLEGRAGPGGKNIAVARTDGILGRER